MINLYTLVVDFIYFCRLVESPLYFHWLVEEALDLTKCVKSYLKIVYHTPKNLYLLERYNKRMPHSALDNFVSNAALSQGNKTWRFNAFRFRKYITKLKIRHQNPKNISLRKQIMSLYGTMFTEMLLSNWF